MTAPVDSVRRRISTVEAIIDSLADRLADHAFVVAGMTADDNAVTQQDRSPRQHWGALSLAEGYPAMALLFAELSHRNERYRRVAHTYLSHAVAHLAQAPPGGLYAGPVAVAFAASCAVRRPADYAKLLEPLDRSIAAWVPRRLAAERERIEAGRPGTTFASYDVITGMTGVGRYLLRRAPKAFDALTEILHYLVALSRPCPDDGPPGWLVAHAADGHDKPGAHLNLGLAHGIPGPLALLSLAWRAGIRVDGQRQAITRIAHWLLDRRIDRSAGPTWSALLHPADLRASPDRVAPSRAAWCYGSPGVARALQIAGQALDRPEWIAIAVESIRGILRQSAYLGVHDAGLCHGWAGLLHITRLIAMDANDTGLLHASTRLADRILGCYDEQAPFGFRASMAPMPETADLAGFLEGAAGVVLALLSFADGTRPATGWDAALLVS
jgi:hypothetical protein